MGAKCPSCGCNGIPPTTYASCCRCNPPSQIVVTSLLYPVTQYTTTGPYVWQSAELIASNMTLSTSGLPAGCYQYKDFVVGDGWDTGQPIGAYDYLNQNAWYSYVNGTQYNDNQVTPWELNVYFTCNNNSTTMRVEFGNAGAQEVFTTTLSANSSVPTQESLCETDSIVSGTTSNLQYYKKLTFTTVKDFNLCDWHGSYTGCDMSNMTLTNGIKTLSGNNDGSQNIRRHVGRLHACPE